MIELFATILKWLLRQGLALVLILTVLVGFAWVQGELKRTDQLAKERAGLAIRQEALSREIAELKQGALQRFTKSQFFESSLIHKRAERQKLWERKLLDAPHPGF